MAEQWEYLSIKPDSDETLNRLGLKGWELVTISDSNIARFMRRKVAEPATEAKKTIPHQCQVKSVSNDSDFLHYDARLKKHFIARVATISYIQYCPWCGEEI